MPAITKNRGIANALRWTVMALTRGITEWTVITKSIPSPLATSSHPVRPLVNTRLHTLHNITCSDYHRCLSANFLTLTVAPFPRLRPLSRGYDGCLPRSRPGFEIDCEFHIATRIPAGAPLLLIAYGHERYVVTQSLVNPIDHNFHSMGRVA